MYNLNTFSPIWLEESRYFLRLYISATPHWVDLLHKPERCSLEQGHTERNKRYWGIHEGFTIEITRRTGDKNTYRHEFWGNESLAQAQVWTMFGPSLWQEVTSMVNGHTQRHRSHFDHTTLVLVTECRYEKNFLSERLIPWFKGDPRKLFFGDMYPIISVSKPRVCEEILNPFHLESFVIWGINIRCAR